MVGVGLKNRPILTYFSLTKVKRQTGLVYYGYRYYAPELGRWISKDPIGKVGGNNLYGFVHNNPVIIYDILGKIYDITYVQGTGWRDHGWIRPGTEYVEGVYNIPFNADPVRYCRNGELYETKKITVKVPKSFGYAPAEHINKWWPFREVSGVWSDNFMYEARIAVNQDPNQISEWETELRTVKYSFKGGPEGVRGKSCSCATKEDILSCIVDKITGGSYRFPSNQCRTNAKEVLEACCLEIGDQKIPAEIGQVLDWHHWEYGWRTKEKCGEDIPEPETPGSSY